MATYFRFQLVKIIDNDADKQVEYNEGSNNDEDEEVEVRPRVVFGIRLLVNLKKKVK